MLIFSQFTRMLDILEDYLALAAYPCERIDGSVGLRERQAAIDRYSKGASLPHNRPHATLANDGAMEFHLLERMPRIVPVCVHATLADFVPTGIASRDVSVRALLRTSCHTEERPQSSPPKELCW